MKGAKTTRRTVSMYVIWVLMLAVVLGTAVMASGNSIRSLVVLDTYTGLMPNGRVGEMMYVVYADGSTADVPCGTMAGFGSSPAEGCVYISKMNDDGQTCLAAVPVASGTLTAANAGETYYAQPQNILEVAKSIALGSGRNYFADDCKYIYISQDSNANWRAESSAKLQDISASVSVCAVIDKDGAISTLYIIGAAARNVLHSKESIVFVAGTNGVVTKLDKDGKLVYLYQYKAFENGEAIENFVSQDAAVCGFYENAYDVANGWYNLSGYAYVDTAEDAKVTGAEILKKETLYLGKYMVVDGDVDVEFTSATKVASAIDGVELSTLAELKGQLDAAEEATAYIVYDNDTGDVLYAYVTEGLKEVSSLSVSALPSKTKYVQAETLDLDGGELLVCYADGTKQTIAMQGEMVSGFDSERVGRQTLTVRYCGAKATFDVKVEGEDATVDAASLIFIAAQDGTASKLDKDGKLISLVQYIAFVDGVAVEGFVSEDSVGTGFYENEYDSENGWYVLSGNRYDDSEKNVKVTECETLTKAAIFSDKYITVDGNVDVELTSATKYASAIDEVSISSLAELKAELNDNDPTDQYVPTADIYVVYDAETGVALYVYVTDIVNEYDEPDVMLSATANVVNDHIVLFVKSKQEISTQVLHIALYSEVGQMLDYIIVPTVEPFTTTNVVFDDNAAVKTAKVFLWDSLTTVTPITDAVEVTVR